MATDSEGRGKAGGGQSAQSTALGVACCPSHCSLFLWRRRDMRQRIRMHVVLMPLVPPRALASGTLVRATTFTEHTETGLRTAACV